jgi:hypothetical protein
VAGQFLTVVAVNLVLVYSQTGRSLKHHVADVTLVRSFSGVNNLMTGQLQRQVECFATIITHIIPLAAMHAYLVIPQDMRESESFVANVTDIVPLPGVADHVCPQLPRLHKTLPTLTTLVLPLFMRAHV